MAIETAIGTLPSTIIGIIIIVAIGLSIGAKKIGLNPVLGYILAGFILGPFFLGFLNPQDALVQGFGEMGLFILLFYLGLELSLKEFLDAGAASFGLAIIDMVASTGIGFLIMFFFGYSIMFSIVVGFMLFSTSTAIVAKFAIDRGLLQNFPTKLAISILILQDFLGILLLVLITSLSKGSGSSIGLALTALIFAVSAFFAVHHLSAKAGKWLIDNGYGHTEITLYALGVGLIVATIGVLLGLSSALGAYFAGFALAETSSGHKIKKDVNFMRDFFLVFFFVAFGTTIFYSNVAESIVLPPFNQLIMLGGLAVLLVLAAFIAHTFSTLIFGPLFGLSRYDSNITATLLLPLGEFVVIIATVAAASGIFGVVESGLISVIAFLVIAVSVIAFQPLYDNIENIRKITNKLPEFFKLKGGKSSARPHTPYTISLLKKFAFNIFIVICFAWMTILLYEEIPRFGVPLLYSRQITSFVIFAFFAAVPFTKAMSAMKKLFSYTIRDFEHEVKSGGKWAHHS